jgi:hypothetical protein
VRVVHKARKPRSVRPWVVLVALVVAAGLAGFALGRMPRDAQHARAAEVGAGEAGPAATNVPRPSARAVAAVHEDAVDMQGPDDLATYVRPGDPEPTGAEVITALQQSGVRTGLGAFNPPGTSPPLDGLAVPDDFDVPEGYVRHHQVTDEGVPIEPILMFSPGVTLRDASGQAVAIPADRVVPPELAPPGLPLRWVRAGKP